MVNQQQQTERLIERGANFIFSALRATARQIIILTQVKLQKRGTGDISPINYLEQKNEL